VKILLYGINYAPELTGVGKYTSEMATWLAARGHEVRCVTAPPYYPQWQVQAGYSAWRWTASMENGVKVFRCPLWVPRRPSAKARILHLLSFAASSLPVLLAQVFWRPQVVWVVEPTFFCTPSALLVARLSSARSWLHIQDFELDAALSLGILRRGSWRNRLKWLESFVMRRFDRVSTISGRMLDKLLQSDVDAKRVRLFPNWVDTSQVRPVDASGMRRALGLSPDACVALYSGNMGEKQGLEILAEAARQLADRDDIQFVFCGEGAAKPRLVELCEGLRNVRFLPLQPAERLPELLCMADVHLLPQRIDAADLVMPSKLTGIMASGGPVVVTAAPGTELFQVVHQIARCGLVVPPEDGAAFAAAIRELSLNRELARCLGKNGRIYAERRLDVEVVLMDFEVESVCVSSENQR